MKRQVESPIIFEDVFIFSHKFTQAGSARVNLAAVSAVL